MLRQWLSAPGMFSIIRKKALKIPDHRKARNGSIPIADALLSAAAMFEMKFGSMLQFEEKAQEEAIKYNLRTLFQVETIPSDTTLREVLDPVPTSEIQKLFKLIIAVAQRGKVFENYEFFQGAYLISCDGTGFFSSNKIHCDFCNVKNHKDGSKTYYHQMFAGALVHPERREVIPFSPEPISNQDGASKNDCERTAAQRFLVRLRREHPHLKIIITEDSLSSNAPHIRLLKELNMQFILGCKEGDHKSLFEFINQSERLGEAHRVSVTKGIEDYTFRWQNSVPLNDSSSNLLINFLEVWVTKKGETTHFSWVTDIEINRDNLMLLMQGGRARWRIENETFNTLKNLGYNFEHNFGHGYQNLSNNLAIIMMLVFLIDQLQQIACTVFQKAVFKAKRISRLWEKMRNLFGFVHFENWEDFLNALAFGIKIKYEINTS